ncbi:MAG: hypothetical protein ACJAZ2_000577 [Glaciecola sp.]
MIHKQTKLTIRILSKSNTVFYVKEGKLDKVKQSFGAFGPDRNLDKKLSICWAFYILLSAQLRAFQVIFPNLDKLFACSPRVKKSNKVGSVALIIPNIENWFAPLLTYQITERTIVC